MYYSAILAGSSDGEYAVADIRRLNAVCIQHFIEPIRSMGESGRSREHAGGSYFRCAASVSTLGYCSRRRRSAAATRKFAIARGRICDPVGRLRVDHLHHQLDDVARRANGC